MKSVSVSEARTQLSTVIDQARDSHTPVYLERHGRRVAAIIDADDLARLLELSEDLEDIRAAEEARAELRATRDEPIPWDEVKAELGLA